MDRVVTISHKQPQKAMITWLSTHVGALIASRMFTTEGSGWVLHYASLIRIQPADQYVLHDHRIEFDDHVPEDLITQFVLTWS